MDNYNYRTNFVRGQHNFKLKIICSLLACFFYQVHELFASPPEGKEWVPYGPMTDEFEGNTLDSSKWYETNPEWRGRPPVLFHKKCIHVGNGCLQVSAFDSLSSSIFTLPKGFTHVCGFIVSKKTARFGYFEVRAKLMNSTLVSGFWLNQHAPEEWSEITIVEVPAGIEKYKNVLMPNVHYFFGPHYKGTINNHLVEPSVINLPINTTDDFHIYGFEWTPTNLRWYVDGIMVRESENRHYFQPLKMNINVESNEYFGALPDDNHLPAAFEVDWVRAWRPAKEFEKIRTAP